MIRSRLAVILTAVIVASTAVPAMAINPETEADLPDNPATLSEAQETPPPAVLSAVDQGVDQSSTAVATTEVTAQEISETTGAPVTAVSKTGTGGTSSVGGCRTVRVTNIGRSYLGFAVYKWWNQLHWCWNRDRKFVYDIKKSWDFWVSATFTFNGVAHTASGYYGWLGALYPKSGYYYNKTGSFTNTCPLPKVCFITTYPKNKIHAHSNGTYWYSKTGT